ncbi:hypothetical protein NIES37_32430 [Tolypothrix tenuis PCC 7101]|uniref:Uncharacterized protein n=1 Tax=Tolypothrix tenuis PCC 7101 TaxID=231146 RepID=A0A1Z4N0M9_9CYAN|nr:hypothetical protein [Aulosira sp. FACHB-113]BAY99264.1 hypothetical protein NIES37_32430 [Tolypothrix tenuis PCC 7101]BAZ76813.1 hypothetical protein NIES50_54150 [Aulosira laxa NIES-50]
MKNIQYIDPNFEQLFAEIDPQVANSFTTEQLAAIQRGLGSSSWNRHSLDIRVSVPIPGLRFYLVLLGGSERRSQKRLRYEKGLYPFWTIKNILFLIAILGIISASSYTIFSFALSYRTAKSKAYYPTSIPWISDQSECENTNRTWSDGKCWDYQHSPDF